MRVFLTTDPVGGVWDYTATLARELYAAGHEVLLAVIGKPAEGQLRALPGGVEVASRDYRLEWMTGAGADVELAGEWLSRIARLWRADVVHLNQMAYAVQPFGAPTLVVVHSDVLSWFTEAQGRAAPAEWSDYARWVRRGLLAADVVVTPTAYQSRLTERNFGRAADRVIHNGTEPVQDPPAPRATPLLLSVGRAWDEGKGMQVLDRALEEMGVLAPPAHLLGELVGPHGQRFIPERLTCHGRTDRAKVERWMEQASIYVGASLYEPFGLAPLEAAMRGCALVLSDIPSFRELWDGCAVFFPKGDAWALGEALSELAHDTQRCAKLGASARTRALRRYTAQRCTGEYLALYEQMAETHGVEHPVSSRVSQQALGT